MKQKKYDDQYNMRIYSSDKEIINELSDKIGLKGRDFLFALIDSYYKGHRDIEETYTIELTMQSRVENKDCSKSTPLRKLSFKGSVKKQGGLEWHALDDIVLGKLEKDFRVHIEKDDIEFYTFGHNINVYKHDEKNCYLVQEILSICAYDDAVTFPMVCEGELVAEPLYVERLSFVKDYDEFLTKFGKYSSKSCIKDVGLVMAKEIGTNYAVMDELF